MRKLAFSRPTSIILGATLLLSIIVLQRSSPCDHSQPITSIGACYQAAYAARAYYDAIVAEDYTQAFRYVATFSTYPELPLQIPYKIQEEHWVNRMRNAKADGVYIAEVRGIEVWTDDAYPMGRASVVIVADGKEHVVAQDIHFMKRERWQIDSVQSEGDFGRLDEALGGHLTQFCMYPENCE